MSELTAQLRAFRDEFCTARELTPEEVNQGKCMVFVPQARDALPDHLSTQPVHSMLVFDDHMEYGGHSWLYHEGKHYDAECVTGVRKFTDLPFWQRALESPPPTSDLQRNEFTEPLFADAATE